MLDGVEKLEVLEASLWRTGVSTFGQHKSNLPYRP